MYLDKHSTCTASMKGALLMWVIIFFIVIIIVLPHSASNRAHNGYILSKCVGET